MAIIDVLTIVDASRVIQDHGKNDAIDTGNYVLLKNNGDGYVDTITPQGAGGASVSIQADRNDVIRWRMTSRAISNPYLCFITHVLITQNRQYITPPVMKQVKIHSPRIEDGTMSSLVPAVITDILWESAVMMKGQITYSVQFCIGSCDNNSATNCGGYEWQNEYIDH